MNKGTPRTDGSRPSRTAGEPDIGQSIDGDLSAQPKSNMTGGADPKTGRLRPAISQGATGTDESVGPDASSMSVVSDADGPSDQPGARDALPVETGEVPQTVTNRGNVPLPEEPVPVRDDTKGRRPRGTAETNGATQRTLRK